MTLLIIQQGNITGQDALSNQAEEVSNTIIQKLYDIAISIPIPQQGEIDNAQVSGHLTVPNCYKYIVLYLAGKIQNPGEQVSDNPTGRFQNLRIDVTGSYAIPFEDSNMLLYLLNLGVGSNGVITTVLAANADIVSNSTNTTITKFNELKYFTNITETGWKQISGSTVVVTRFNEWTALLEIDVSNFTRIGSESGTGWELAFHGCTSLKKVKASPKLSVIGYKAFDGCSELEDFTDLPGEIQRTINVYGFAFNGCLKLKPDTFNNCTLNIGFTENGYEFKDCKLLTTLSISGSIIGNRSFSGCTALTTVNGGGSFTLIGENSFRECTNLSSIDISNVTRISVFAFYKCRSLTSITLSSRITSILDSAFSGCTSLTVTILATTPPTIGNHVFDNIVAIKVPQGSLSAYQTAWSDYASIISEV